LLTLLFLAALGGGAWALLRQRRSGATDAERNVPTFTVRRGPLTISVTEAGAIKPREQVTIKSEVEGQSTVISLVAEGERVKKGDLLMELDASRLQDERVDQQIRVQNGEAAFIRARENLAVTKNQADSDIARAELDYQFAQEDLANYQEGEFPTQLKKAESEITLAKEELERAAQKLEWSEKLFSEDYISRTELVGDRLAKKRAELEHELAQDSLRLLQEHTYKRKLAELESDVDQTKMALERVKRKAKADVVQAEADLKAKESEFERQKSKLEKIQEQIGKTKIYAPINGMVVYASSAKGSWRGNAEPLAEGQAVRERQELIYLPTADAMMAEVKVHESNLQKVRVGLPVHITVDALPGRVYAGTIAKIAPLPDAQSIWLNPDLKIFTTEIHIEVDGSTMHTGMSCQAEIVVEEYEDAVYVPVQAVFRVNGQPTAYVLENGVTAPRNVKLGLDNNRMARILEGLEPGEEVLLTPPLGRTSAAGDGKTPADGGKRARSRPAGTPKPAKAPPKPAEPGKPRTAPSASPPATAAAPAGDGAGDKSAQPAGPPAMGGPSPSAAPGAGGAADARAARGQRGGRGMSAEEREKRRKWFESLSPEEREKVKQQMRKRMQQGGSRGSSNRDPGGRE